MSTRRNIMKRFHIIIYIFMVSYLLSGCFYKSNMIIIDKQQSTNAGQYTAYSNGYMYFYNNIKDAEGIYRTKIGVEDVELIIKDKNVSYLCVDNENLIYAVDNKQIPGTTSFTSRIEYININIQPYYKKLLFNMYLCYNLYLNAEKLYCYGIIQKSDKNEYSNSDIDIYSVNIFSPKPSESISRVEYIHEIIPSSEPFTTIKYSKIDELCLIYRHEQDIDDYARYLLDLKNNITVIGNFWEGRWSSHKFIKYDDSGFLFVDYNIVKKMDFSGNTDVFATLPEQKHFENIVYSGYKIINENKILFVAQSYKNNFKNEINLSTRIHVSDYIIEVDINGKVIQLFETEYYSERIVFFNETSVYVVKDGCLYRINYDDGKYILVDDLTQYKGEIIVEPCGNYLLFFANRILKQVIPIVPFKNSISTTVQ